MVGQVSAQSIVLLITGIVCIVVGAYFLANAPKMRKSEIDRIRSKKRLSFIDKANLKILEDPSDIWNWRIGAVAWIIFGGLIVHDVLSSGLLIVP